MKHKKWFFVVGVSVALVLAGCGTNDDAGESSASDSTAAPTTMAAPTTTTAELTTTTVAPTTTLDPNLPEALLELGYPVSDDYVIETVISDLGAGTGGLAIDPDGNFFHGDFGGFEDGPGNRVLRISPDGSEVDVLVESELMGRNTSTVFGSDGALYQSAFGPDRLFAISTDDGTAVQLAEKLVGPAGIVAGDDGSVLVQSFSLNKIWHVAPDGTLSDFTASPAPRFNGPNGMVAGPDGTIYSVNFRDGGLLEVDPSGEEVTLLHKFPKPNAHVALLDGGLFVTSRTGYVVWRYDLETGEVVIVAGNGEPGDADGRGIESSFGSPNAITVGPDGHLYMNHGDLDQNNPTTIRRLRFDPS